MSDAMLLVERVNDADLTKPAVENGWVCVECESVYALDPMYRSEVVDIEDCVVCPGEATCMPAFVYRCPVEGRECEDDSHHFGLGIHVEEEL